MRGTLFFVAMLLAVGMCQLVVKKELLSSSASGIHKIRVSYRKSSSESVSGVQIKDALPEYLELESGKLVLKGHAVRTC